MFYEIKRKCLFPFLLSCPDHLPPLAPPFIFKWITSALGIAGTASLLPFVNLKPQVTANLHMELFQLWLQLWLLFPSSFYSGIPAAFILWAQPVRGLTSHQLSTGGKIVWVQLGSYSAQQWCMQSIHKWVISSLKWGISELGEAVNWQMDFERAHWVKSESGKIFNYGKFQMLWKCF